MDSDGIIGKEEFKKFVIAIELKLKGQDKKKRHLSITAEDMDMEKVLAKRTTS